MCLSILRIFSLKFYNQYGQDEFDYVQRLYFYTKRVREFHFGTEFLSIENASRLALIYRHCKGNPLFPALRRLYLGPWPLSPTEAHLLFSPSLFSITFTQTKSTAFPVGFCSKLTRWQQKQLCIQLLVKRSPNISELHIEDLEDFSHGETRFLDPVLNTKKITNISMLCPYSSPLTDPRPEWLERLSRMGQLRVLQFDAS